jgi:hypothetical protein
LEESPVKSSGSNGIVERAVQSIEGQVRVLKLALENRIGIKVPSTSCIVAFLAEYSAYLLNRLEIGKDGKTAVERNKGKAASVMGIEFGEKLMFKKKVKDKSAKIEARWENGIFVGVRVLSGEFWVATPFGIRKCRSVRRLPVQERWSTDSVAWVKNVPWHLYRGDVAADGEIPEDNSVEPAAVQSRGAGLEGIVLKAREPPPRAFQIRKEDAERHGYSRGCAGCTSWFRGLGRQPHSPECRARFEGLLKDDARFQNAERRKAEYEERVKERAAKKARKEEERGQRRPREAVEADAGDGGQASSSSSGPSAGRPLQPQPLIATEGRHMEVEQATDVWESLLKKIKRPRSEGDMEVSEISRVLEEIEKECEKNQAAQYSGICEVRAAIIEEMVAAKLWSSGPGDNLKTLEGPQSVRFLSQSSAAVFSSDGAGIVAQTFLPDMYGRTDVFGIDVFGDFAPSLPEYSRTWEDEFCPQEGASQSLDPKPSGSRKLWSDELDDSEDLEKYVREYWQEASAFAWDDVNGGVLDLAKVREARKEEVDFMKEKKIWREVPVEEAWKVTGKAPVSVKWVDTMKSGGLVRCRLVARDFRMKGDKDREDLFAATPPLELLKALIAKAAMDRRRKVLVIDVKKAHLNPICQQDVYIELPAEAGAGPGVCGKLEHWLYGFRPAAQAWENHYAANLASQGFARGVASPVLFWNAQCDVSCLVHGDDFVFVGEPSGLDTIEDSMQQWYEVKVKARLGCEEGDAKEVEVLGRRVRCTERGYEFEADPGHRSKVLEALGFGDNTKELSVNGKVEEEKDETELQGAEATSFRAIAARLNYLSQDSPDIQFAAKEVCRDMSKPSVGSWRKLKVLARFLLGRERVAWK